ncbi:hypothetical protein AURDEDRAFT_163792, partial [Auricularia subglabra TFB-10046 SS5]
MPEPAGAATVWFSLLERHEICPVFAAEPGAQAPALPSSSPWPVPPSPSASRRRPVPALSLPDELLLHVLSSPTLRALDVAAACLVCRRWLPCARQALYGAAELCLPDARLASTLWNAGHLRALVRRVRFRARPKIDAASAAGWLCLPGARPRSLALDGHSAALAAVLASAPAALAGLRHLSLCAPGIALPLPPALEALEVVGALGPGAASATVRVLTVRRPAMPLRLAGFPALRRLVLLLPPGFRPFVPNPVEWRDVPRTVELLVVSVALLGVDPSRPPPHLQIELVSPGILSRDAARALAGSVRSVSCDCELGALELLESS